MALVAAFGLICETVDVTNAFLNAFLEREVYVECPPGFNVLGIVWKLHRALYGLRIAPKLRFEEFTAFVATLGFNPCPEEPCLLINYETGLIIFFFVDGFLLIGSQHRRQEIEELKARIRAKYQIKELGDPTSFLNIAIRRDVEARKLWIGQRGYIDKLETKFHLESLRSRPIKTPLTPGYKPIPNEGQATTGEIKAYQQRTGSLLYAAVVTRPDIAFAVSLMCRFNSNPSPRHRQEVDRILGYLIHTRDLELEYSVDVSDESKPVFEVSSDASFADDLETRKSTQGYLMMLFNGPIAWQSRKQTSVTTSTTEAELLSLSHAARETIAICRLFSHIKFVFGDDTPKIWCDNKQTVGLITRERPSQTSKLRHVEIYNFWLRQAHKNELVEVDWKSTADMVADGLTKALGTAPHEQFLKQLGMAKTPRLPASSAFAAVDMRSETVDEDAFTDEDDYTD
jgi:hypothetical protein